MDAGNAGNGLGQLDGRSGSSGLDKLRALRDTSGGRIRSRYSTDPALPGAAAVADGPSTDGSAAGGAGLVRVAWAGRTSTYDQQDPTLSLPRQLRSCLAVLPDEASVVAHFYDIESGRSEFSARGRGSAHEMFSIPITRDGGIQDLLAEAERPGRRFDVVICESIDRIARRTYIGTDIEHRLEQLGVRLLAADEPFTLTVQPGRRAKVATALLTRRVKQGISEFYVVEMLEKSWDGFAVHTEEGFNIGKPCYGYRERRVPHPVPAKRAKGQKKTFLEPDPAQAPTVQAIFGWRLDERLGYRAIAERLNRDLAIHPPPVPVDPARAVGRWTGSSVREVLTNPKHTGHMVWNQRARKSGGNVRNPVAQWVWSPQTVHEALVELETFIAVQEIGGHRFGSRSEPGANTAHRQTKRSYLLRSYLFCALCGRRMYGKTRRDRAYYVCAPARGYGQEHHPGASTLWVPETVLLDRLNEFLCAHVFGQYRRALLAARLPEIDADTQRKHAQGLDALRRAIADVQTKGRRLVRNLEAVDDLDPELVRDISARRVELRGQQQELETQLAAAEAQVHELSNPALVDELPLGTIRVEDLPEELARSLFEALRLCLRYDRSTHRLTCSVTLAGPHLPGARTAADRAITRPTGDTNPTDTTDDGNPSIPDRAVPILVVPPAGHHKEGNGPDLVKQTGRLQAEASYSLSDCR